VDRANGRARLDLTIGGHPAPLAIRSGGAVERVGLPGTLLGGLDHPSLADTTTQIHSGETLVLFTDGLLESRDRKEATDFAWPERALTGSNGDSAERVADRLLETALQRQGGVPRDDIAVVVLRRSP
jgi:sigma-B regulation protein RsbU (phosphoserine phosphatase)